MSTSPSREYLLLTRGEIEKEILTQQNLNKELMNEIRELKIKIKSLRLLLKKQGSN